MGCCDPARRAAVDATARSASTASSHHGPVNRPPTRLHYLGHRAVEVRGGTTGRVYRFDARARTQSVDPKDLAGLLRTKLFRLA